MPSPRNLQLNRPPLFSPSISRFSGDGSSGGNGFYETTLSAMSGTALENSSSFRYSLQKDGIRSTQQLNVDWSAFENHTFFNSAYVKTNVAFRKIFDQFPFDGAQGEVESFLDNLTGFERYVYDSFPKNKGYLFFSGTLPSETGVSGTYVTTKDVAGASFPGISRNLTGQTILNPGLSSMTVEFQVYMPALANSGSFLLNKYVDSAVSGTHGFGVLTAPTSSTTEGKLTFKVASGSYTLSADATLNKGEWNHVAFVWDRRTAQNKIISYLNGNLHSSSSQIEIGAMNMDSADLIIGSGSAVPFFTGSVAFSGALDELRIWHSIRSQAERDESEKKGVYAQSGLKLYYKFNEPSGSQSSAVLDSSGNCLHGTLCSWAETREIRNVATSSVAGESPMTYEKEEYNPILFPLHPDVEDLNQTYLDSADEFDRVNPNRIDRLIPQHYLLQGQDQDGLLTEQGAIIDALSATGTTPDTAKLGDTQVILMLLYTWAKFFDEMKLYIQAFGDLQQIDYDSTDTIPDAFLEFLAQQHGVTLPQMFTGSSITQFINAENIDNQISTNNYSLQYIQNQIWRRILLNVQDVLKSKGTVHSVKTFIRSVGIEPDNNFRIREFGGPTMRTLTNTRETRSEVSSLLEFSGSAYARSGYLSGSRTDTETGYPAVPPGTTYSGGVATNGSVGLFTSGSWTFEGIYRFPTTSSLTTTTQSLARLHSTGSSAPTDGFVFANLIATTGGVITFAVTPSPSSSLELTVSGGIFDGNPWYISFGRQRADELSSDVSSSYFLRVAKQSFGDIVEARVTSSYCFEDSNIFWSNKEAVYNASGAWVAVGSQSIATGGAGLNSGSFSSFYRTSAFDGRAGHFRFWSKALEEAEWREHARNFKSLGVSDPLTNFNFVTTESGSFQRLRMDVTTDQPVTASDGAGALYLTDFSQNGLHWTGSFAITSSVVVPQRFQYSLISPKFDVGATTDKVRVRSFQSYENVASSSYAQVAPLYATNPSDAPQDNTRFTVDYSIVDALDQDMVNLFSTLDILDNIIGNPELIFSPDYPDLENLRNVYFNRLTDMVNLKGLFEFYKWFDTNVGTFIAQLVPRKTKFLGTNFVIESHMLERPKLEYLSADIYLGDSYRHAMKDTILFLQIAGNVARY
ncbi:MAG: LamG domain-containing protein [Spirochaetes bacterium]|nr:MAG: LamG domain-containing protein [Spirochaetota bacterium]